MRVFALATAALAASVWASAPAAAQNFKPEVIQKACSDMTFNQIGEGLAGLVQKYEFSSNPEEAEQQAIGLLCPSSVAAAEEPQSEAAGEPQAETRQASMVQEAMLPPPPQRRLPPPPHFRQPPPRGMMPPLVSIPRLPPPPPGGYGHRRPPPSGAMASMHGYRERYHEEHYRSIGPRRLPLTSSVRGEPYCMAETDPERFVREFPAPHAACEIGPIPGKPCPGWVCHRR